MSIVGADLISFLTGGVLETYDFSIPSATAAETQLDKKLLPKVEKLINKLGKVITYRTYPNAVVDEIASSVELGDPVDIGIKSLPPSQVKNSLVNGDVIRTGDMVTGIAGKDVPFVPDTDTTIAIVDGVLHRISIVKPVYSGERICLYTLVLRKA